MYPQRLLRGMSFMDVIVGTALVLVIFTALVGLLQSSLQVASLAKTRSIATAVAESQMEYIRSLSYDQVGTVGGIPAGSIPQNSTTTSNGADYPVRTFIDYVDDPADGAGSADTNGITTDYKRIKVTVSYYANKRTQTLSIVSNYAPPGIETTTNGGTLKISVVNASGAGVPGATVHIVNTGLSPGIDLSTFTDSTGTVFLPGAPTSTEYQVNVSKDGYSGAQTYTRDSTNQNPTPGYLTVVKGQTTTGTFAIDLFSTLTVQTFLPVATSTFSDSFASGANVVSFTNTVISGGNVSLAAGSGGYPLSGSVRSAPQSPTYLAQWGTATATTSAPAGTSIRFHIVDGAGALLPDTAVPGNAAGFVGSVDLSRVSVSTYPALALSADFSTSDSGTTPLLQGWSISYARGPIPYASVPFTLTGTKTVGSTGAGVPIYKTIVATSTNSGGSAALSLEWDAYTMTFASFDVVSSCNAPPYSLAPGTSLTSSLMIGSSTPNMALVSVRSAGGAVDGAAVTLTSGAYTKTVSADSCGSAYFGSLTSGAYSISVTKTGYTTFNATGVSISGHDFYPVTMQ